MRLVEMGIGVRIMDTGGRMRMSAALRELGILRIVDCMGISIKRARIIPTQHVLSIISICEWRPHFRFQRPTVLL